LQEKAGVERKKHTLADFEPPVNRKDSIREDGVTKGIQIEFIIFMEVEPRIFAWPCPIVPAVQFSSAYFFFAIYVTTRHDLQCLSNHLRRQSNNTEMPMSSDTFVQRELCLPKPSSFADVVVGALCDQNSMLAVSIDDLDVLTALKSGYLVADLGP
jgi:hypothetical protein